jgi:hypothetical protein
MYVHNNSGRGGNWDGGNNCGQFAIINGRRIPVAGGMSGRDLQQAVGDAPGRRAVMLDGLHAKTIDSSHYYQENELVGRNGKPIKATSIPDRTKGGLFDGYRDQSSRDLIRRQVYDVAANFAYSGLEFDEDDSSWVVFPSFRMPRNWGVSHAPMMILFPTDYPRVAPVGFYLPNHLNSPHGHFFDRAYHEASAAPTQAGWNWFCCFISGVWRPAPDDGRNAWKKGDNLWTYLTLVNEVLHSGPAM